MRILISLAMMAVLSLAFAAVWAADPAPDMTSVEGKHIILKLRTEDMKLINDPKGWVDKLDRIYEGYADLVGATPYNGEKITILSVDQDPGGWAVAGNPIEWYQPCVVGVIDQINQGDWLFGIMHEIGHNFDLDYRWAWNAEFFANWKMDYALQYAKGTVLFNDKFCDYADPNGNRTSEGYHANAVNSGRGVYMLDGGIEGDSEHDKLNQIIKDIGWEPFKKTLRELWKMDPKNMPIDSVGKRSLFMNVLDKHSGKPAVPRFVDWGCTIMESTTPDADAFAKALKDRDWVISLDARVITTSPNKKIPITVEISEAKETIFPKGLGTHAASEIVYNLDGKYELFETYIGVTGRDNARGLMGSIVFEIVTDGKTRYKSPIMTGGRAFRYAQAKLSGVKELKLLVHEGDDGGGSDHAGWGDAKLVDAKGNITYLSSLKPVKATQGYGRLRMNSDLDGAPLLFGYAPSLREAEVVAAYIDPTTNERKNVTVERLPDSGLYTCTFDPMPKGLHRVWLTIQPSGSPLILHEMVFVKVE